MNSYLGRKRASPENEPVLDNWENDETENQVEHLKRNLKKDDNAAWDSGCPTNEFSTNYEASSADQDKKELFVRNISFKATEDDLKEFFNKYGEVHKVKIVSKDGQPKGFGFVEFFTHESAQKAIDDHGGLNFQGRQLDVKFSEGKSNDKKDFNNDRPKREFNNDRPRREFNNERGNARGRGRGGFDRGRGRGAFDRDSRRNESECSEKPNFFGNRSGEERPRRDGGSATLFAKNLPYSATEDDLRSFFSKFGPINSIRLGKGFCHINFQNESDLEKALAQNGEDFNGRKLILDKAQPRSNDGNAERGNRNFADRGNRGGRGRGRGRNEH